MADEGASRASETRPQSDDDELTPEEQAELQTLLDAIASEETREAPEMPLEYRYLEQKLKLQEIKLRRKYAKQEIDLRRKYARGLLIVLAIQLAIADVVFVAFAWAGEGWKLPSAVIEIWLAAVVVQVIGVVTVVTLHLFPRRDGSRGVTPGDPP